MVVGKLGIKWVNLHIFERDFFIWDFFVERKPQDFRLVLQEISKDFTHVLSIEFLPYFINLLSDEIVELDSFFNFADGIKCGGMVAAAEFRSYFRQTELKFASEEVHGDLARFGDVFTAIGATKVFGADLEVLGGFVDNLFRREITRFGGGALAV